MILHSRSSEPSSFHPKADRKPATSSKPGTPSQFKAGTTRKAEGPRTVPPCTSGCQKKKVAPAKQCRPHTRARLSGNDWNAVRARLVALGQATPRPEREGGGCRPRSPGSRRSRVGWRLALRVSLPGLFMIGCAGLARSWRGRPRLSARPAPAPLFGQFPTAAMRVAPQASICLGNPSPRGLRVCLTSAAAPTSMLPAFAAGFRRVRCGPEASLALRLASAVTPWAAIPLTAARARPRLELRQLSALAVAGMLPGTGFPAAHFGRAQSALQPADCTLWERGQAGYVLSR